MSTTGAAQGPLLEAEPQELEALRRALSGARGDEFWRRLEQLSATPALRAFLEREFPSQAPRWGSTLERREFLRLMGASLGVMGLAACTRQPEERIYPFARSPEHQVPGRPLYFASAMALGGAAVGVLVESHMGRPTKIEGNPDHPSSLGATDAFAQAAVLGLYDPDRSHSLLENGLIGTWSGFTATLLGRLEGLAARSGEGLAVLHCAEHSPLLAAQLERLVGRLPRARVARWTSVHRDQERAGAPSAAT
jgi:molybdopterin-containing oxidoreductase family iron-sulfur binding subunit